MSSLLATVRHRQGRLIGRMESLGFSLRAEAVLQSLTEEVVKSNEIEGERLDREQVRSSRQLSARGFFPDERLVAAAARAIRDV